MGLLRLLPLQGGYSSHHRCDEQLELPDTHHAFTLDPHGFPLLRHMVLHAPSTSLTNNHLQQHMLHRSPGVLVIVLGETGLGFCSSVIVLGETCCSVLQIAP